MPLQPNWTATLGKGIRQLRLGSAQTSVQVRPLLLSAGPASRHLPRPLRHTQLGVSNRLQSHRLIQATGKGLFGPSSPQPPPAAAARASSRDFMTGSSASPGPSSVAMAGRGAAAAAGTALQQQQQQQQAEAAPPSPSIIQLTVASGAVVAPDLDYTVVLDMLHKNASANLAASQAGGVVLGLTSPAGPTDSLDIVIGQLNFKRLLACARNKLWWMTPEWRTDSWALPPETQFLLAEMAAGGPYALLLPLIDGEFRATLRPPAK